ncbi:MAG TPA: hypothetical protein ENN99_04680 [Chloroflexi bacterium]|nr:hypothetical protein [Chloroflexota bacterium]
MNSPSSLSARGYLIAFIATAVWSTAAILIGYLTTRFQMPPLALAFWRDLIVAVALGGALAVGARPLLRLERRDLPFSVVYGLVLAVFNALWTVSITLNGAAVSTVLVHSSPAFTVLVAWRWWGERLDIPKIGAVILSLAGCILASGAYHPATWRIDPLGILIGLLPGLAFAVYSLMGKLSSRRGTSPWTTTLYSFAFGTAFLLLVQRPETFFWLSRPMAVGMSSWREAALCWGILIALAIGPTAGGYGLYTASLAYLPAGTANLIITFEPVMTAMMAFLFLGERLTVVQLGGGGLILVGVILLRLSEQSTRSNGPD